MIGLMKLTEASIVFQFLCRITEVLKTEELLINVKTSRAAYPRFDISNVFRAFIVVTGNFTRIIDANKEEKSIQFIIQRSRLEKTKTKEELNVKWM